MSDTPADTGAAAPEPSPPAPTPADAGGGGDELAELPADQALFPRSYVEKIRTEAQKYRTEAQTAAQRVAEYDKVYADYEDADRKAWFDLAETWKVDPNAAASWMRDVAAKVLGDGDDIQDTGEQAEALDEIEAAGLTPDQVQQMITEALTTRDQAAAQERAVNTVYDELRGHGIDPDTADGLWVLATTNQENITLDEAVAKFRQRDQKIIDDYVAGRTKGTHPIPGPNGGVAANQTTEILTFEEARKATEAFLRAQGAAGP